MLCNRWVQKNRAKFSRTEAQIHAELKYCMCPFVNTTPQCHDDNFRPDTLSNSDVVHMRYTKLLIIVKLRQILPCGAFFSPP